MEEDQLSQLRIEHVFPTVRQEHYPLHSYLHGLIKLAVNG